MNEFDGEVLLTQLLEQANETIETEKRMKAAPTPNDDDEKDTSTDTHTQWALGGNGRFLPVGQTVAALPASIYEPFISGSQWGLEQLKVSSDDIYILPDMATEKVLSEVQKFWNSESKYRTHKLLYKRGIILWGPPGGGKTVAIKLLMNELVAKNGVVILANNVNLTVACLKAIRRIEPKRNLIVVFEDIDDIIQYNGESTVLSVLDGENNVDNILNLATTNYPERLGARIINRPSRFDRRVYVGMPNSSAREAYLQKATNNGLLPAQMTKWVKDTDDMSIAHLRELVAAVYCLEQPYEEVIERLKNMAKPEKGDDGFRSKKTGFSATPTQFFSTVSLGAMP